MGTELFSPGHNCWAVPSASFAGAIVDTSNYFRAFMHAAMQAERTIYLSGWQFDSKADLLRGEEARNFPAPARFLEFLNFLCERRPALRIYVLAWDYSAVFGADHEWRQQWLFRWRGHRHLRFAFDSRHPVGACHHQKVVVIDGFWAFLGGMDICKSRWDVPGHPADNPLRVNSDGNRKYRPKHDIQVALEGEPAEELARWFVNQWSAATTVPVVTSEPIPKTERPFEVTVELPPGPVALSMTRGRTLIPPRRPVKEIQALYEDAIHGARRMIYIESQYFTARAVHQALARRMNDRSKGPLEIAVLMPKEREIMEYYGIIGTESRLIRSFLERGRRLGHRVGVFHPMTPTSSGSRSVQQHSKTAIIDDNVLIIGSANLANRSMGFDSEINAAWAAGDGSPLASSIRLLRARLLAEHLGFDPASPPDPFYRLKGIVAAIDAIGQRRRRIRRWRSPVISPVVAHFTSERTVIDPTSPPVEDTVEAFVKDSRNSPIARGMSSLLEWMSRRRARSRRAAREIPVEIGAKKTPDGREGKTFKEN